MMATPTIMPPPIIPPSIIPLLLRRCCIHAQRDNLAVGSWCPLSTQSRPKLCRCSWPSSGAWLSSRTRSDLQFRTAGRGRREKPGFAAQFRRVKRSLSTDDSQRRRRTAPLIEQLPPCSPNTWTRWRREVDSNFQRWPLQHRGERRKSANCRFEKDTAEKLRPAIFGHGRVCSRSLEYRSPLLLRQTVRRGPV